MRESANPIYEFGPFRLDTIKRVLLCEGEPVPLTSKVFDTLLVLVQHGGQLLTKDELLQTLWPDSIVEESNLTQNISVLRKALGESPDKDRKLKNVRSWRVEDPFLWLLHKLDVIPAARNSR